MIKFEIAGKGNVKSNSECLKNNSKMSPAASHAKQFEPVSSIRYKLACAYSKYSNQSVHAHSLIRVLVFHLRRDFGLFV